MQMILSGAREIEIISQFSILQTFTELDKLIQSSSAFAFKPFS
jgi:hypothetical protein